MPFQNPIQQKKPKNRKVGYIFALAFNILFLYIANNLIVWEAQLITNEWSEVLGIINVSLIINIMAYLVFIFYDGRVFYFIARLLMDIFGFIVAYRLYRVFPFDFNGFFEMGWLNDVFPYLLILGMVGIVIGLIVRTVRLIQNKIIVLIIINPKKHVLFSAFGQRHYHHLGLFKKQRSKNLVA